MSEIKITDLVDPRAIEELKALDTELRTVLETYVKVAQDLNKGIDMPVKGMDDLNKLEEYTNRKLKEAADVNEKLINVTQRRTQAVINTTNTMARHLMEQERVNKQTREAYTDSEKFKSLLEQVNGSYENRVKRLIETNQELAANKKQQDNLKKAVESGKMSLEEYNRRLVQLTMKERELKQEKADLTAHLKNEEREMQSVEGTYRNMSQRLELMKKAYKDLTEEERNSPLGKEMVTAIQDLDAHLKDLAADMGEFQRNVGNYAVANSDLKKKYDDLVGTLAALQAQYAALSDAEKKSEQGQGLAQQIQETSNAAKETKQSIEEHNAALEEARRSLGETGGKTSSVKRDLKELVLEIANLTIEYQNLTAEEQASAEGQALAEHITELTEKAGVLKDAIADTNQAISNAASDTRGFDQVGGALQLAIDGFGLAEGAAAALGIEQGTLAEIQTKLQAAIAASNAMQSIQNTLQAQSAVMQGVNLVQTKLRTVAENLHTAAQGKGTIATAALTAAQWAFNAAANANPIGLLVVAIVAATAAVWGLCKAFAAFIGPGQDALDNYAQQKEALEAMCEANDLLIERMKARGATEAEVLNQSLQNKQAEKEAADALFAQACELYDEDEDEYKEAVENKKKADEDFEASKEDSLNYLLKVIHDSEEEEKKERLGTYEYKRQLIQEELKQQKALAATLLAQEKITRQTYENLVASLDKAAAQKTNAVNKEEKKGNGGGSRRVGGGGSRRRTSSGSGSSSSGNDLQKEIQAGEDAILKIIEDSNERQIQAEILSYSRKLKELQKHLAKTKKTQISLRTALYNQIEGLTAEHNRKMFDLEIAGYERRYSSMNEFIQVHLDCVEEGSEEELEWHKKQLANQRNIEYTAIAKKERARMITEEQANEMRATMHEKYAMLETRLIEEHAAKQSDLIQERYATEQIFADKEYSDQVNALKTKYAEDLKLAGNNYAKQEELKKKRDEDLAKLDENYAIQTAAASVAMFEEILQNEDLSAEDRMKIEKDLAKAKIDLANKTTEAMVAASELANTKDKESLEKRIANAQKWLQVAGDACNAVNELVGQVYDNKLQKIEEDQTANEEAGQKEQERISELVEKNVITEEEGEARKRAVEAQTAKKNEELEKKKAKLKERQAKFDKANSIAQAMIATALSLMQLWVSPGWPAAIPMISVVGAMGALQIATILATPLPKYAKGTKSHKGGYAIVGDGGQEEVVSFRGEHWLTPAKPTLLDLPKGASVAPSVDTFLRDNILTLPDVGKVIPETPKVVVNNDFGRLEEKVDTLIYNLKLKHRSDRQMATEQQLRYLKDRL